MSGPIAKEEWALAAVLVLALLLGGSSSGGAVAHLLLQLIGIAIAAYCFVRWRDTVEPAERMLLLFAALSFGLVLLHLMPLPPALWTSLPGRGFVTEGMALLGISPPWLAFSLTPINTVSVAVWLAPPLGALLLAVRTDRKSFLVPAAVVGVAILSLMVGVLQTISGAGSELYFYRITNQGSAVGFFANRNHFTSLLLVSLPCLALLMRLNRQRGRIESGAAMWTISATAAVLAIFGILLSRSDAGLALLIPALVGSFAVYRNFEVRPLIIIATAILGLLVMMVVMLFTPLLESKLSGAGSRAEIFATTADAIGAFWPSGSGLGSFLNVYRLQENPDLVGTIYVNHAHNDYLELALETGLVGVALVILFLAWWARLTLAVWQSGSCQAKAASVGTAILLVHSAADYPLRTPALAVLFVVLLAMMAAPFAKGPQQRQKRPRAEGGAA